MTKEEIEKSEKGVRFNNQKIRHDLLEPHAINELARVFTAGAQKYSDNNWLKGLPWSNMLASLKRHINAFERGEDFDPETGCYHMAHAAWNALGIISYYKYHPECDDRLHTIIGSPRIALDIDDCIADFTGGWAKLNNQPIPTAWQFDRMLIEKFDIMRYNGKLDEFYLNLRPKIDPKEIPFEPIAYVTARPVESAITEKWLDIHGFPAAPVHTVGVNKSKLQILKEVGADWFVDDNHTTFMELNKNGICCFLIDAPHNQRYDVSYKRIYSLKELRR